MDAVAATLAAPIATVLLATDLTAASADATTRAMELAGQLRARLLVLHVIDPGRRLLRSVGPPRPVEERLERTDVVSAIAANARRAGIAATFLVWDGEAAASILAAAEAESADMIVVGTRSRGPVGRLLGSVSDEVLRRARVPVMVVRPRQP
jgi:nucleotide-binding universal stress UspA family protein